MEFIHSNYGSVNIGQQLNVDVQSEKKAETEKNNAAAAANANAENSNAAKANADTASANNDVAEAQVVAEAESPIFLNSNRGYKIDLIRVFNSLYMLGFFTGKGGQKVSKKDFFTTIGKTLNIDLSNYDKDLSRALSDSTALDKHLDIFNRMRAKMEEAFNNYGGK